MAKYRRENLIALLLFAIGIGVRIALIGSVPAGINQDEAFAAYEAWSILKYGVDSSLHSYPVYLIAWGSGMNALESYLMMPFIALFGLETWTIRMPQLLVACLSLYMAYLMTKEAHGTKAGLWMLGLSAICPWHIMLSRWALESNLAPGFMLFGMFFLHKAMKNSRYLLLAALMYGLSLYCYATIWPIVPAVIIVQLIIALKSGMKADRYLLISTLILGLLALPLMLFLAVNYGYMEEMKIGIFSVPKLLQMRSNEISFQKIPENLKTLKNILLYQQDGLFWNSAGKLGILYYISMPLAIIGLFRKKKVLDGFMLVQLAAALVLGCLISTNVNRVNIIFIPIIYFAARGAELLCSRVKVAKLVLPLVYAAMFISFESYYFTDYAKTIPYYFCDGLESAVEAVENREGTVYLPDNVFHSQIMYASKISPYEYAETVEYRYYPSAYLKAKSFGRYVFGFDSSNIDENAIYIIAPGENRENFEKSGFVMERHGVYTLAYKE